MTVGTVKWFNADKVASQERCKRLWTQAPM
jgi:hypothetical protein